jgi:hypothetical protein
MPAQVFNWSRYLALCFSVAWALFFGYVEAVALDYSTLQEILFDHFTIESVLVGMAALIIGLLPFAVAIRFGTSNLAKRSLLCAFQVFWLGVLCEDIAYFASIGVSIKPSDWTAQIFGGIYVPGTIIFIPIWYLLAAGCILLSQVGISRVK